jgi:hypothetical protein
LQQELLAVVVIDAEAIADQIPQLAEFGIADRYEQ